MATASSASFVLVRIVWSPNPLPLEQLLALESVSVKLVSRTDGLGGVATNVGPPLNVLNRELNPRSSTKRSGSLVSSSLIRETTENVSANLGYKFGQDEETYNIVAAHGYFGRLLFHYASFSLIDR